VRWRRHRGCLPTLAFAAIAVAASASQAGDRQATGRLAATLDARLQAVAKTETLLDDKYRLREGETRARVRALYKLTRAGWARLWLDPDERRSSSRRRAAARRIMRRDFRELELLRGEIAAAAEARGSLEQQTVDAPAVRPPKPGTLQAPVAGVVLTRFGSYRHRRSRARLTRRGIEMRSRTDEEVRALAEGEVRYAGPVRGLDHAVVVAHDGLYTVVGKLAAVRVEIGQRVSRGAVVGNAAARRVYVEVRLALGGGGQPIDPAPLLE